MIRSLQERTRNELIKSIHWSKKAVVINLYHYHKLQTEKKWTISDTSRDLQVSRAFICEDIKLAKALVKHPQLVKMGRKEALKFVRS